MTDPVKIALIQLLSAIMVASMTSGAIIFGAIYASKKVVKSVDGIVTKLTDAKDATIQVKDDVIAIKNERIVAVQSSAHAEGVLEEKERQS